MTEQALSQIASDRVDRTLCVLYGDFSDRRIIRGHCAIFEERIGKETVKDRDRFPCRTAKGIGARSQARDACAQAVLTLFVSK
jgi:hypothetical protein